MKKCLLITLLGIIHVFQLQAQTPDSLVYISGRVFNESTGAYQANTDVWVNGAFKVATNDTGLFELSFFRAEFFPAYSELNLTVQNCDGWYKDFVISISSNFDNHFTGITLTICDSTPNTSTNYPVAFNQISAEEFEIITDAQFAFYLTDGEFGYFFGEPTIYLYEYQQGLTRVQLIDEFGQIISDQFVAIGITENEIPCDFAFAPYALDNSDLEAYLYHYKKGNPFAEVSITFNGVPYQMDNIGIVQLPAPGNYNVCMTSTLAGTCQMQKCEPIVITPAAELCNAQFTIEIDQFGSDIHPLVTEMNISSIDNADSMIIRVNGMEEHYPIIQTRSIYPKKTTGNEICLKVFRGDCTDETCQTIDIPAEPAPAGCIVSINSFLDGINNNVYYGRTPTDIVANSFSWNLGDGTIINQPDVKHIYTQEGTYYITLTTTFNECVATSYDTVIIDFSVNCSYDFRVLKYSENRVAAYNTTAYFELPNQAQDINWWSDGNLIGTGYTLNHQFPNTEVVEICQVYNVPDFCQSNLCKDVDLSYDTIGIQVNLEGFDAGTNFSDSKFVLYEFLTTMGGYPVQIDEDFELAYVVRDTIQVDNNGSAVLDSLFMGFYGIKFIPGPAIGDTTILPCYTNNQLLWGQMNIQSLTYYSSGLTDVSIQKRTLVDNLGTGLVIGNINFGPFRLSEDFNPLDKANLILFHKNNPVRFISLNGNSNFQLSELSNGVYTLTLDLPGHRASSVNFIISEDNQVQNVVLNYDEIVFDDFTPPSEVGIESNTEELITLFPNPTSNVLYLSGVPNYASLQITDISGKQITVSAVPSANFTTIDVSFLPQGFYILSITNTEGKKAFRKFIKS